MGKITLPELEYFDLVRRASCWNTILSVCKDKGSIEAKMILMLEEENEKDRKKEVLRYGHTV